MLIRLALALLLFSLIPTNLLANMASPARAGQLNVEPTGLEKIAITRETLTIDLRSLSQNQAALVEAIYQLNNSAAAQKIELVFVAAAQNVQHFQVWLDEQEIPSQAMERQNLPSSWQAPRHTPGFNSGQEILFAALPATLTKPLQFAITIPAGAHKIKVKYQSALSFNVSGEPIKYWQFAYVLAPARDWASFGGLDITVNLPLGYRHASSLPLQQNKEILRGSFSEIPADALTMTLQLMPPRAYQFADAFGFWIFVASLPLGLLVCLWLGWKQTHKQSTGWLSAFAGAAAGAIVIGLSGWFAIFGAEYFIPEKEIAHYGYGSFFQVVGLLLLAMFIFALSLAVFFLTAKIVRRKWA